ncbi:hypothetical protein L6452_02276 [Arctium lappa]|uniref:Uncharacterized protein n=1 Tax=Arctium lappa TaxID=4217 RepID=A0ACB9FIZ2_ARCLA|nr:hypothetical protein L6452_02276 [Arctium lappa]
MVEESVFDGGENNNGIKDQEEEEGKSTATAGRKKKEIENEPEKEVRSSEHQRNKRAAVDGGDSSEVSPENEEGEASSNNVEFGHGKFPRVDCGSPKVQTTKERDSMKENLNYVQLSKLDKVVEIIQGWNKSVGLGQNKETEKEITIEKGGETQYGSGPAGYEEENNRLMTLLSNSVEEIRDTGG